MKNMSLEIKQNQSEVSSMGADVSIGFNCLVDKIPYFFNV